ncbi:MAG: YbaB/EbfC family nucleoid-associated protein [Oscillospiraceae bacterium]|nr:YbaB/EbfC family nucleoid-associated protein [Oscillospiraceae bacterium]
MAKGGFRGMPGGMGGMSQAQMMKQAQKMQQELLRMQEEQETKTYTASAGGGMVSATVNGKHEVVAISINPEAVDPDDVEMLQDMVIAAVNEAMRTADAEAAQNMSRLTGGMNLGGLF